MRIRLATIAALLPLTAACNSDDPNPIPPTCPAGSERCACYGNGTCNTGLICLSGLCVRPVGDGGQVGDSEAGDSTGGDPTPGDPTLGDAPEGDGRGDGDGVFGDSTDLPGIDLCPTVQPHSGWVSDRTRIEICANNANGKGLVPVPEVFLLVDPDGNGEDVTEVRLIRESFVNMSADLSSSGGPADASVMSTVVPSAEEPRGAGIVVPTTPGNKYAIRVVNPDGATGVIVGAFEVLPDRPPVITRISPEQALVNQGLQPVTIAGSYLKDPTGSTLARVLLVTRESITGDLVEHNCLNATPTDPTPPADTYTQVTCDVDTDAVPTGSYLVRYEHLDDLSFSEYATFVLTNPSGKLASEPVFMDGQLQTARLAHGAAVGRDDLGNTYLYAVGGQTGNTPDTAIDTVEVAALSRFGFVATWIEVTEKLPQPLTGLSLVAHESYLFVVGGSDNQGTPVNTVFRVLVLGADSAPHIKAPTAVADGSLEEGTYSYKVSALMGPGSDNVGADGSYGEGLPSDAETIRVTGDELSVTLTWDAVPGAASYRIYRTRLANQLIGTEQLMKDVGNVLTYTDTGDVVEESAAFPLAPGATGKWMVMPGLTIPRADAGATIASWTDTGEVPAVTHHYVYVVGGLSAAGTYEDTYDYSELILSETTGMWSLAAFQSDNTNKLSNGRSELIVATLDEHTAPRIAPTHDNYVIAATGTDAGFYYGHIDCAKVGVDGLLQTWTLADNASGSSPRWGASGALVNNFLYSVSGKGSSYLEKGVRAEVCNVSGCTTTAPPPLSWAGGDAGITIPPGQARYRAGAVYAAGYFYLIGGQSESTTAFATVFRGSY
ncbi:hypothetical protein ACFL6C_02700 [Myxococcota bacterium]